MSTSEYVPYCGVPPVPGELWQNWNLDPVLIAALGALGIAYGWGARRFGRELGLEVWRMRCFAGGWVVLAAMLVSPICNLTVALFSARVGQHMVLTLAAAPLLILGRPEMLLAAAWPRFGAIAARLSAALPAGGLTGGAISFAALLWLWHMPAPYEATLSSDGIYWLMHLTLFASALVLWKALLDVEAAARLRGSLGALATSMQMGLLGAVLTFSAQPYFDSHATTTWSWGLSPLQDQQLGGLIMWVPGGLALLITATVLFAGMLRSLEAESGAA